MFTPLKDELWSHFDKLQILYAECANQVDGLEKCYASICPLVNCLRLSLEVVQVTSLRIGEETRKGT